MNWQSNSAQFALPPLPELLGASVFGQTIRYYDVGDGPALLLVHGIGGDADEWAFILAALAAAHRVIALDLPGFGRSEKPHIEYSIAFFVEMLDRFLCMLNIERVAPIGNSLGGWIAATFALQFPERVDRLVLVDAAGVWEGVTELPFDLRISTREHLADVFRHLFYDQRLATDELIDLAYQQHLERGDNYAISSLLRNLRDRREHLDQRIAGLQAPTLIVWGENDEMIPVATARRIQQSVSGSQLRIFSECGHLPALEKPSEFVRCVLDFLRQ